MALAIDAFVDVFGGNNSPVVFPALTTTSASDVIIVSLCGLVGGTPAITVSDTAGLTWTQRAVIDPLGFIPIYEWYAISPGTLSGDVISITWSGGPNQSSYTVATAVAISGANTTTPFDTNASLPTTGQVDPAVLSTTASHTIVFMGLRSGDQSPTPGTGWTQLVTNVGSNYWMWEYQIFSTAQTNVNVTLGDSGSGIGYIADAIQAVSGAIFTWSDLGQGQRDTPSARTEIVSYKPHSELARSKFPIGYERRPSGLIARV